MPRIARVVTADSSIRYHNLSVERNDLNICMFHILYAIMYKIVYAR